jgi:hypothetical protein
MASSSTTAALGRPAVVYIIIGTRYEHNRDREGRKELAIYDAFSSVREANAVARELFFAEFDEESRINEVDEESDHESTTICYKASVRLFQDGLDTYAIKVEELEMNYPRVLKTATRAFNAAPGS